MEVKKSKLNHKPANQPKQTKVKRQATNSRQIGIGMYCFSLISIPPYLCAYLRAYCSRISTQRPLRTYTNPTLPPPI